MPLPAASEAGKHPKTASSRVAPPKAAAICLNLLWLPPSALRGHGRICPATIRFLPCFTATLHGMHAWTTLDDPCRTWRVASDKDRHGPAQSLASSLAPHAPFPCEHIAYDVQARSTVVQGECCVA